MLWSGLWSGNGHIGDILPTILWVESQFLFDWWGRGGGNIHVEIRVYGCGG